MKHEFKGTKGKWSLGTMNMVCSEHHPICDVTKGLWGDEYPTLKIEGPSLQTSCVPVMDMIVYGEVSEEEGKANGQLIATAPELLEVLQEMVDAFPNTNMEQQDLKVKAIEIINRALNTTEP